MRFYNLINDKKDIFNIGKHRDVENKEYVAKLIVEEGRKGKQRAYELEILYGMVMFYWGSRFIGLYELIEFVSLKLREMSLFSYLRYLDI